MTTFIHLILPGKELASSVADVDDCDAYRE
jgi:hypothetical protein